MSSTSRSAKRQTILEAATDVFLSIGYDAASMDKIAQRAGVSKITIYKHFENKEALFSEIVLDRCDRMLEPLQREQSEQVSVREGLMAMSQHLLSTLTNDRAMDLYRLVIGETQKFPELGQAFYSGGPRRAMDGLAQWLAAQGERGALKVDDPQQAAALFFGLVGGHMTSRRLLIPAERIAAGDLDAHARKAVDVFLAYYAP